MIPACLDNTVNSYKRSVSCFILQHKSMIISKNYLHEKIDKSCAGYFCSLCNMLLFCFGKKEHTFRSVVKIKKRIVILKEHA